MQFVRKVILFSVFIFVTGIVIGCSNPSSPSAIDLNSEGTNHQGETVVSAVKKSGILAVDASCGNPNDWLPDDMALQACLDRGGTVVLDPGSPGYIVNGLNGEPTKGLVIKSGTHLTSSGGSMRATIIAGKDLRDFILRTPNGGASNFEIRDISFDGMLDTMTSAGPYRVPDSNCNAGNLALEGSNFRFIHNESKHSLCGTGLILIGSFYDVQDNYIAYNGTDEFAGGPWSDGITAISCDHGYIAHNVFVDNTDIDLAIGGGLGCTVELNTIGHFGKSSFSGLNIGNFSGGDHTGSFYRANTIYSSSPNRMRMGLSIGSHMWDTGVWVLNAGNVTDNVIYGANINLVVDGIYGGTVQRNTMHDPYHVAGQTCNYSGMNYTVNSLHATNTSLQSGWTEMKYDSDSCPSVPLNPLNLKNWMRK